MSVVPISSSLNISNPSRPYTPAYLAIDDKKLADERRQLAAQINEEETRKAEEKGLVKICFRRSHGCRSCNGTNIDCKSYIPNYIINTQAYTPRT